MIFIFKCGKFNDHFIKAQENIYDFVINIMTLIGRKRSVFNRYRRIISFALKFKLIPVTSFNQCFFSFKIVREKNSVFHEIFLIVVKCQPEKIKIKIQINIYQIDSGKVITG